MRYCWVRYFVTGTIAVICGASLVTLLSMTADAQQPPTARATSPLARPEDEQAIRRVVDSLTKAFNAQDAKSVAGLFTTDAEIVDEDGNVTLGRPAIQQIFADLFKEHPKAKIKIAIESIRFLSPVLAVEEGRSTVTHEPDEKAQSSRYLVVHVKQDGKWQMASARDLSDDDSLADGELAQLDWLIGDWVDESADALVKASYHWDDQHKFILGDFALQIAGRPAMTGTHRIGWDPLAKQIHSWVFDSQGGFAEGLWTRDKDQWLVKLSGVTRQGEVGSGTYVYTRLGANRYSFDSRDRVVGGKVTEDLKKIIVVRQPPKPKK